MKERAGSRRWVGHAVHSSDLPSLGRTDQVVGGWASHLFERGAHGVVRLERRLNQTSGRQREAMTPDERAGREREDRRSGGYARHPSGSRRA